MRIWVRTGITVVSLLLFPLLLQAANYQEGMNAFHHRDYQKAGAIFLSMADEGDIASLLMLGKMARKGLGADEPDFQAAMFFYMRASAKGDIDAILELGDMWKKGEMPKQAGLNHAAMYKTFHCVAKTSNKHGRAKQYQRLVYGKLSKPEQKQARAWAKSWDVSIKHNAPDQKVNCTALEG